MGFYLRKSLRLGPLRFNLSKRGVGASVGVKGFRVGRRADGHDYVAAGREGLYYRQTLNGRSGAGGWLGWAMLALLVGGFIAAVTS